MKEEQKIFEEKLRALEEGLQHKVPECKKKFEHKTSLSIRSLYLILLLELMLFLAGSCYIIFQRYYPSENKDIATAFEKYISTLNSKSEAQKLDPTTEMSEKLVKSDIIVDQVNNLLEDMELIKEQELTQNKISATDADSMMRKSTQNSINVENDNTMRASDFNSWLRIKLSLGNLNLNNEFVKDLVPRQFLSSKYIDDSTNENAEVVQFFKRLGDIDEIESKIEVDLKDFQSKNDVTHDTNRLTLNSKETHGSSDASNKFKSLKFYVTSISNSDDSINHRINLINNLQIWKQKLFDLVSDFFEETTPNEKENSEKNVFDDEINRQANNDLESGYVICPPNQPDVSEESSAKDFLISQSVSAQETLEQMENESNANNKDKPNVDDSNVSMSTSLNSSKKNDSFLFDVLINSMANIESQHLLEIAANIKADEKHDSTENDSTETEIWDWQDSVKHSTSNDDKFQWFNVPARFTDDLQPGPMDISKLSDTKIYQFSSENPEYIEDFIPGSQCQMHIVTDILIVKCPAINFEEGWNLTSAEKQTFDSDISDINDSGSFFYDFYDDDQLNEQLTSLFNVPKITDTVELQENAPSVKILNVLPERINLDFVRDPKIIHDDAAHNLDEKEIRPITRIVSPSSYKFDSDYIDSNEKFIQLETLNSKQQEALETEEHNALDNNYLTISAEVLSDFIASVLEKKLVSIFNNETKSLIDYIRSIKPPSSEDDYMDAIRNQPLYIWTTSSPDSWRPQYDAARKIVKDIRNREFPYALWDNTNEKYRKKRMILTEWQSVENTIDESNENVEILQRLKKIFQKIEILAAYIDRLHERYLLHNKLDDDYMSSEFPTEIRKRRT